jgi:hypothetical protein
MKAYINSEATVKDFHEGMNVKYVPTHVDGDISHPDCEEGIVSWVNNQTVFVKYFRHGILQSTSQGTDPKDLIVLT